MILPLWDLKLWGHICLHTTCAAPVQDFWGMLDTRPAQTKPSAAEAKQNLEDAMAVSQRMKSAA